MHHHTQHRRWFLSSVVIILVLAIATPVLADYIGPNRTVTETRTGTCKIILNECQYVPSKDIYTYKNAGSWSCSNEDKPWQQYPNSPPRSCTRSAVGDNYWSREESTETVTVTYPPATIGSSLQNCTLQNGWCITVPQLSLSGSEPVAGYNIYAIEGSLNGQIFGCTSSSCNVPLVQGNNNFTYWALSSFLDSSEMGTFIAKVDSQLPNISGTLNGTLGSNGWYTSSVSFIGSASDATSGLASFTCSLDGVALGSCNTISVNNNGLHTIVLTARDNAGHTRTITQNASVDTQNPALNASVNGTLGSNDWYTEARLSATASDPSPGSGLAVLEYNLDGSGWIPFPVSGTLNLSDGKHSVNLRAVDKAGRTVTSSKSFWLDREAPDVTLDSAGTIGQNDWYITRPSITASAQDDTSGTDVFDYNIDQNGWQAYTTSLTLDNGIHTVSVWAQDAAGLVTQIDRTYQVDTRRPQIAGSLSGTPGMNGWYISPVTLAVSASDPAPGSGMDAFTYVLNGDAETPYTDPLLLPDGEHMVQLHATDKAGLLYSIEQSLKVDTLPPALNVETSFPDWINDNLTIQGTVSDSGSGLSSVEVSTDGGQTWQDLTGLDAEAWNYTWNTLESANGKHQVNVRVTDLAGLTTEQAFPVSVDNYAPEIILPDSWLQWDTVTLDILDNHSGLSAASVEITDPEGRWPPRVIQLDPEQFPLSLKWDRRFGDDTRAKPGTYPVKVTASDKLGNTTNKNASIKILLDIFPAGPTSTPQRYIRPEPTHTPSYTAVVTSSPKATQTAIVHTFGVIEPTTPATPTSQTPPTPRATPTQIGVEDWLESIFVPNLEQGSTIEIGPLEESEESPPPVGTESNTVLWGTAAAAAIGAATAYVQEEKRKREEEEARQAELAARAEERREKMKERKIQKMEEKRAQERAWEEARLEQKTLEAFEGLAARSRLKNEMTDWEMQEEANWVASQAAIREKYEEKKKKEEEKKKAEERKKLQERKERLENSKIQEEETTVTTPAEKTWWDKALDFVDEHQKEIALTVGIVAGVTAVVLSGGLAIPAVLAISAATVGAGMIVGGGTVALNAYYDRPWHENLLTNVAIAGGAAAVVSTAGFVFQAAATGISSYCGLHPSTCARVEPVLKAVDLVEEHWLKAKLAVQTWRGDQAGAAETAFEIQTEYMDGGMPGNAVAKELGDQLTHLSKNAAPVIQKYGTDIVPLLLKHGDEGLALIQKHGVDGIDLLRKHGNDVTDLIHLDKDVLDYVMQQGDDAVAALSRWSAEDLRKHGLELALRAKKDADVLAAIKKLTSSGPLDPKKLTKEQKELIEAVAANSTQYADNGQVVLGKWVDISNGFVQTAQETGSVHYNPHPDMWTMLGNLGDAKQEEVAWLINQQVVKTGIKKGLPFEYTLNGVPDEIIDNEHKAIEAIFAGKSDNVIKQILQSKNMPIRMKELQELQKAGYQFSFDDMNNSYVLIHP